MLACSEMKAGALVAGLEALGAEVLVFPVIRIRAVTDHSIMDAALDELAEYSWIIFTSAYGVRFFLNRMQERGIAKDRCRRLRICAVGPATADALERSGIRVSLVPGEFAAEGILAALAEKHGGMNGLAGLRILLPRAREARDLLPRALQAAGARVDVVPCYENTLPELDRDCVQSVLRHPPHLLVFTSSSTVNNFVTLLGNIHGVKMLADATVAVLGPVTARTVAAFGKQAEIVPCENTIPSLLESIRLYYQAPERKESGVRSRESE
ncbi:MAG: uroporphyrinogen-III synthase [Acidobacteriia bacterium]|nr:uroporphyrinogen-III synthase [Terriglobia bacterium]